MAIDDNKLCFNPLTVKAAFRRVNVGLYARNDANIYKPYLVNFTSNVCKFMDKKASGLYLNSFMNILKTFSNVNHSCPFKGYLIANNLSLDVKHMPLPPLPLNSYKLLLIFYEGYPLDYMGTVSLYTDLINSKK
ncbi:uncharacterized protein LOC135959743 [Calliphora vicina]|uniref:uncharacterized protein LOC135959743 n=1 Tax=Calliphora vicina TaxID=7373 RepID=UPI00325BDF70